MGRTGVDPAITGEPPEEQARLRAPPVEPDGAGPSQPSQSGRSPRQGPGKRGGTAVVPDVRARRPRGPVPLRTPGCRSQETSRVAYPLHRSSGSQSQPAVPASPDLPALEHEVLAYWEADGTFLASVEARAAGENGANEFVFYDGPPVRQRPAALRSPAHRLRQGRRPALPDHARPQGRAPIRLGHPRPARRARGRAASRHHRQVADRRDGHRRVQRRLPRVGAEVHRRVAGLRHPPGPLGRLRQRLQDARPRPTWSR